jgi:hypothetical protein
MSGQAQADQVGDQAAQVEQEYRREDKRESKAMDAKFLAPKFNANPRLSAQVFSKAALRDRQRDRQESSSRHVVDSDLLRRFSGAASHLLLGSGPADSLSSPRSLQRARAVQAKIFPLSSSCRQLALLAQLFRQEAREPARTLDRSTIYCPVHRRIGHHRLGLGVGAAPRGNEIERWMVGVARTAGNDSSQGAQGMSTRPASECRSPARPHGQTLPGQPDQAVCGALRKMSFKCPALMSEIKDLVPWLHENKIRLDVVYIRSEANLADAPSRQRGL